MTPEPAKKEQPSSTPLALVQSDAEPTDTQAVSESQVDMETGEVFTQPTLDPTLFPAMNRRSVPMVKIAFSGTVEMTRSEFDAYCDQGLEPGRIVDMRISGYLPNPHAKWVKRSETVGDGKRKETHTWWEPEGQVKVKALELGSFELGGVYTDEE